MKNTDPQTSFYATPSTDDYFVLTAVPEMSLGFETNSYNPRSKEWSQLSLVAHPINATRNWVFNVGNSELGGVGLYAIFYSDYVNYHAFYNEFGECVIGSRRNWMPDAVADQLKSKFNQLIGTPLHRWRRIYHGAADRDAQLAAANANTNANSNNIYNVGNFGNFPTFG